MNCYQCPAPAMYQVGEQNIPLCLNCYSKVAHLEQQQLENHERMLNYLNDEMAAIVGIPPMGPRFPTRPKPVHIGDVRLNNISVSNSVVGTINTGSIGSLDQSISALVQLNETHLAQAFKGLSEAILQSGDLTRNQRNELIEAVNAISREAATPLETRQNTVALSLLDRAQKITSTANDISELCQRYWPAIATAFASVTG
ncbi:hypothetical protein [Achromobacter marplatensis]|uniref:hypothetical protein n=1 Tax=Achromobacter marplatensis TaxID=470868 RepID=UPI00103AC747|nr:hypothetical protein [Achromobacter marplatensis]